MKTIFHDNGIKLVTTPEQKVSLKIRKIFDHSDYDIQRVFYEQYQRLDSAEFQSLIQSENNQTLGFLNLVDENIENTLFLDIAVMREFRNQQVGKIAITKMLETYQTSKYLIAETQIDNVSANHMLNFFGDSFYQEDDRRYYFIENETTCSDFLNDRAFTDLKEKNKVKLKSKFYQR